MKCSAVEQREVSPLTEKLKDLRKRHGLTWQALAERAGLSMRTMALIERGNSIKMNTLLKIVGVYQLSEDEFLDVLIAWLHSELGEFGDKIEMRPAANLNEGDQFLHLFYSLPDSEQQQIVKAMRSPRVMAALKLLNRSFDRVAGKN